MLQSLRVILSILSYFLLAPIPTFASMLLGAEASRCDASADSALTPEEFPFGKELFSLL